MDERKKELIIKCDDTLNIENTEIQTLSFTDADCIIDADVKLPTVDSIEDAIYRARRDDAQCSLEELNLGVCGYIEE